MEIAPYSTEAWKTVVVSSPGAGADWTYVVPSKYLLIKSVTAKLAQGATQTPQPILVIQDDSNNVFAEAVGATAAQAINTTCIYTWAGGMVQSGIQGSGATEHAQSPLPCNESLLIKPNWKIGTSTLGIGANSQWSAIVLYVMEDG